MTWRSVALTIIVSSWLTACRSQAPPLEKAAGTTARDQIALTPSEQAMGAIETRPAEVSEAAAHMRVPGRIARAEDHVWRVGVRTSGLVAQVSGNLGDIVRDGQVLARYHADELRDGRSKYRTAIAELRRLEAAATQAQRNLERTQTLLNLKAASQLQVEQARQDQVAADAALQSARIEVERAKDVLEDDLHVAADPRPGDPEADSVPILSPAAGYVLEKNVTVGRAVQPGTDAFVIGDLSELWMLASVRQQDLVNLREGQTAIVSPSGVADQYYPGRVANLGQELDPLTRTMQVRIVVKNKGYRLRPEMLADAEISIGPPKPVLLIPSDAVQQINGQDVVFVRTAPDRFMLRAVEIGPISEGKTPIVNGLRAGELVVTRGSFVLKSHLLRASMEE
jgi:multidrug efflux pump subunit AcrA (membrane-fusion protein)